MILGLPLTAAVLILLVGFATAYVIAVAWDALLSKLRRR